VDFPRFGCINVHASLLPRWRGASPIQAAILNGDLETGVTIMKIGVGLDDGPILSQKTLPLKSNETAGELTSRLAIDGAFLLSSMLSGYLDGKITPIQQDESQATYAPRIKKTDGLLNFTKSATELERQVRAFNPWPGAYFQFQGVAIRVFASQPVTSSFLAPGEVGVLDRKPVIGTSSGGLAILELQMPGKRRVLGSDFLRGARNWCGMVDFD
jgi:methionyl-tRNA formyltransferase